MVDEALHKRSAIWPSADTILQYSVIQYIAYKYEWRSSTDTYTCNLSISVSIR